MGLVLGSQERRMLPISPRFNSKWHVKFLTSIIFNFGLTSNIGTHTEPECLPPLTFWFLYKNGGFTGGEISYDMGSYWGIYIEEKMT